MTRIPPVRRLLMDAKALIAKPENWIQGENARSAKGRVVGLRSSSACRFCGYAAILRVGDGVHVSVTTRAWLIIEEGLIFGLIGFNDALATTHPMIMRLFNKAIRRAKEQGI